MPAAALRAVLDTNILVAALLNPDGPNATVLRSALESRFILVTSPPILAEMACVLRDDFNWPEPLLQARIRSLAKVAAWVSPRVPLSIVVADPDDNRILECALEGQADLIVTNDHHLLNLGRCRHIPIITGPDFRRMLEPA